MSNYKGFPICQARKTVTFTEGRWQQQPTGFSRRATCRKATSKGADRQNYKRSSTQRRWRCRPWCKTHAGASFV